MTYETPVATAPPARRPPRRPPAGQGVALGRRRGAVATVIMAVLALVWLFPLLWALVNSFREYDYTQSQRLPLLRRLDLRQLRGGVDARRTSGCT